MGMLSEIGFVLGEVIEDMHSEIGASHSKEVRDALQRNVEKLEKIMRDYLGR